MLRGVSLKNAAIAIGVTVQQMQKYETAANRVSAPRLKQLAVAYGIDLNDFFPPAKPKANNIDSQVLVSRRAIALLKAYEEIENPEAQHALLELARAAAKLFSKAAPDV